MTAAPSHSDWLYETSERVRQARAQAQPIVIRGHGSKQFYGRPVPAEVPVLSTESYSGVVDYDPTELVVVAKCGTPIAELEALLAGAQQMLAFEPPRLGGRGTVGGMMATGLSGPRRMAAGAAKDFVLGMTVLDDQAMPLRFGGTVMKNVAGYDLSRLHTGALGTLGLIVDVSLKVLPMPPAQETIVFETSAAQSIDWANAWAGQPLPISATSWRDGRFTVRLSGAVAAVRAAKQKLGGQAMPQAQAEEFWQRLRDQADPFFFAETAADSDRHLWRLSVPSTSPHITEIDDPQWIEWGGALRWVNTNAHSSQVRSVAHRLGGHATLYRAAQDQARLEHGVFAELSPAILKLHQRLKQELDPQRIFNPGRMYAGL